MIVVLPDFRVVQLVEASATVGSSTASASTIDITIFIVRSC